MDGWTGKPFLCSLCGVPEGKAYYCSLHSERLAEKMDGGISGVFSFCFRGHISVHSRRVISCSTLVVQDSQLLNCVCSDSVRTKTMKLN